MGGLDADAPVAGNDNAMFWLGAKGDTPKVRRLFLRARYGRFAVSFEDWRKIVKHVSYEEFEGYLPPPGVE